MLEGQIILEGLYAQLLYKCAFGRVPEENSGTTVFGRSDYLAPTLRTYTATMLMLMLGVRGRSSWVSRKALAFWKELKENPSHEFT
jgi:hypothetical protein